MTESASNSDNETTIYTSLSCVFGLCVKNNSVGLPKVYDNINKIRGLFKECSVIVYYDISRDNSLQLVRVLSKHYDLPTYILNEYGNLTVNAIRTVCIERARNSILREIYTNPRFLEYELFAMMDSNDYSCQGNIIPDVVNKYLKKGGNDKHDGLYEQWDSLSFARVPYYDLWAYSDDVFQIGCWCYPRMARVFGETTVYKYQDDMRKHLDDTIFAKENEGKLVEVDSAFCGFAFYKKDVFYGCVYNGRNTNVAYMDRNKLQGNLTRYRLMRMAQTGECEHRQFHMMAKMNKNAKIMIACEKVFE